MKWIKFDPDAWLCGTRALTAPEKGIYIDLIAILYSRDGKLPNDDKAVARMLQCQLRTWCVFRDKLVAKGKIRLLADGNWTANRVENELKIAREFIENSSRIHRTNPNTEQNQHPKRHRARATTTTTYINSSFGIESEHISDRPLSREESGRKSIEPSGGSLATALLGSALREPPNAVPNGKQPLIISEELVAHEKRKQPRH